MYALLLICGLFSVCLFSQRGKRGNDCSDARRHKERKGKRSRESDHRLLCYEGNYRMKIMGTAEMQVKPNNENFGTSTGMGSNPGLVSA